MSQKARLFKDSELLARKEEDPVIIKRYGKLVKGFKQPVWESRIDEGLIAKFQQNSGS